MESAHTAALGIVSLRERLLTGRAVVAGVLSGTSADGIDVGLARFARSQARLARAQLCAFRTVPYEPELKRRLERAFEVPVLALAEVAALTRDLGVAFGRAVRELADESGQSVELIGSHGQTLFHHDGNESAAGRATLQLGDGDWIAEQAGCWVVSDFRQRDLACGGEGAPLSPLADDLIFAAGPRPLAILNLGGIANWTILRAGEPPLGFDTGPACRLLDALSLRLLGLAHDAGGAVALTGRVSDAWVAELESHPFLSAAPPKSTGRDTFGAAWIDAVLARAAALGLREPADLLASAAEFVARAALDALERFVPCAVRRIVLCGGGAHHARVVDTLAARAGVPVVRGDDEGVPADAREALVFAVLGARCILGEASSPLAVTGARGGTVLGKISPPGVAVSRKVER